MNYFSELVIGNSNGSSASTRHALERSGAAVGVYLGAPCRAGGFLRLCNACLPAVAVRAGDTADLHIRLLAWEASLKTLLNSLAWFGGVFLSLTYAKMCAKQGTPPESCWHRDQPLKPASRRGFEAWSLWSWKCVEHL